ncbi:MAG: hypothetical protein V2I25_10920 [Woeseiaceae bacterium]|nr:hypothetical protein [Woeseiaceae bacterium]
MSARNRKALIPSRMAVAALVAAALLLSTLPVIEAEAQVRPRPATTKASAKASRPKVNRTMPRRYVNTTKAQANAAKRSARTRDNRSAMGDGRRNGMRLGRSPVTSWSGWNRASAPRAGSASAPTRTKASSSMRVRFRSNPAK